MLRLGKKMGFLNKLLSIVKKFPVATLEICFKLRKKKL